MPWVTFSFLLTIFLSLSLTYAEDLPHFSKDGYRISYYRSATPTHIDFGTLITTDALVNKIASNPELIIIDVQPITWRYGIFLLDSERKSLPNSVWLPNVGWGEAEEHWIRYFKDHLSQLTEQDFNKEIVLFCTADCWMSWNAVRRAAQWGYNRLYWYAEGTDGWYAAGLPLIEVKPEPLGDEALLYTE